MAAILPVHANRCFEHLKMHSFRYFGGEMTSEINAITYRNAYLLHETQRKLRMVHDRKSSKPTGGAVRLYGTFFCGPTSGAVRS